MAQSSTIEWTEATWNPVTGCTKISPGCKFCYAERMAFRLQAMGQVRYRNAFKLTLQPDAIEAPLHWKQPRVIFVNSMSDLFHKDVPAEFIQSFSWQTLAELTLGAAIFLALAIGVFSLGLRRYESGSAIQTEV